MKVIAVIASDIHLQDKPPVFRSAEPDWWAAQRRGLDELRRASEKHKCAVVYAGDIFNHWKTSPELLNFALEYLPEGYAVPGQHDLPFHNYDDMDKSGYGTLVKVGKLKNLPPRKPVHVGDNLRLWGFPWGCPLKVLPTFVGKKEGTVDLAVVHAYVWRDGKSYPGADEEKRVSVYAKSLLGFNAAVFGDNHIGFTAFKNGCDIMNCGTFMRRTVAEIDYQPIYGLLLEDGSIESVNLDISLDKVLPREQGITIDAEGFKMEDFMKELESLGRTNLDFRQALKDYLTTYEISKAAETILLEALETAHD